MSTTSGIGLAICVTLCACSQVVGQVTAFPWTQPSSIGLEAWQGHSQANVATTCRHQIYYLRVNTKDGQEKEDKVHLNDDILTGFFVALTSAADMVRKTVTLCRRV